MGRCLRELAPTLKHQFVFTDVAELDITSPRDVEVICEAERPDWLVNCAAYTAVDRAEQEPDKARLLNATAVGILSDAAQRVGAGIVHISTDYVFRGDQPEPRVESDPVDPQSVYGVTKLEGERMAARNPKHITLRTSWLYSAYGNNFVKTMRRMGAERDEVSVVADQWGSPTSAHDLARAVICAIEHPTYGLYHFSNEGTTSWALFAEQIMQHSGLHCTVKHISTAEYGAAAPRPAFSLLDKHKFVTTFGMVIPEWEASLEQVIEKLDSLAAMRPIGG